MNTAKTKTTSSVLAQGKKVQKAIQKVNQELKVMFQMARSRAPSKGGMPQWHKDKISEGMLRARAKKEAAASVKPARVSRSAPREQAAVPA